MSTYQLSLEGIASKEIHPGMAYHEKLVALLSGDLSFHDRGSRYASHNYHSFPAKFPPQLPHKFIMGLTVVGDVVLDPMMGSGTTIVEADLIGRHAIGFDIDPLARLVSRVKVTPVNAHQVRAARQQILRGARSTLEQKGDPLSALLDRRWDRATRRFVDYWFAPRTQRELLSLRLEIEKMGKGALRDFFDLAFSAIIITKNGGVSLAFDLAHTRPHRAKVVLSGSGEPLLGEDLVDSDNHRVQILTKTLRSALDEFDRRVSRNLRGIAQQREGRPLPDIRFGDAQAMPLDKECVDLIVTSPPYASNAIDYMRAHKFSLTWLGYPIDDLGQRRKEYIGGEAITGFDFEALPGIARTVVAELADVDEKKGRVLHRYYSEMTRVLGEMYRVLKPGKAAIVVVGSSTLRGVDTRTEACLAEIGQMLGFEVPKIGVRELDRNRRMMPAGTTVDLGSQIQQRMHEEYVIGFMKPSDCTEAGSMERP